MTTTFTSGQGGSSASGARSSLPFWLGHAEQLADEPRHRVPQMFLSGGLQGRLLARGFTPRRAYGRASRRSTRQSPAEEFERGSSPGVASPNVLARASLSHARKVPRTREEGTVRTTPPARSESFRCTRMTRATIARAARTRRVLCGQIFFRSRHSRRSARGDRLHPSVDHVGSSTTRPNVPRSRHRVLARLHEEGQGEGPSREGDRVGRFRRGVLRRRRHAIGECPSWIRGRGRVRGAIRAGNCR